MNRAVAFTIVGLGVAATAGAAFGQAAFLFSNYAVPYVPIQYHTGVPGVPGVNVGPDDGVTIEVWWAPGADAPESSLLFGDIAHWSAFAGYTDRNQVFTIADFSTAGGSPTTYTVQLRATTGWPTGYDLGRGPLVDVAVAAQDVIPPEVPLHTRTPGFMLIPEPSTFALGGLGAAVLFVVRRHS